LKDKESKGIKSPQKKYPKYELRVENMGPNGLIHLTHIGVGLDEFDVHIISRHLYRSGKNEWYELDGESVKENVWIDPEEEDGLHLSITLKKVNLRVIGISKPQLEEMKELSW
jgi:hypothetical protein